MLLTIGEVIRITPRGLEVNSLALLGTHQRWYTQGGLEMMDSG